MRRHFALTALLVAACAHLMLGTAVMADQTEPTGNVSLSSTTPPLTGPLRINGHTFKDVRPVSSRIQSLEAAVNITNDNGIDEIYVKDSSGRLYVAYGYFSNADSIAKTGWPGHMGNSMVEVVAVNNEMNTYSEAFYSGIDDLKGILKSLLNENFGKLVGTLGLGSAAILGRQLLMHPLVAQSFLGAAQAALPVLGTSLMWTGGVAAAAAALWPTVIKPLLAYFKRIYLDRQKDNANTIAMVTAEDAAGLEAPVTITDRQEGTPREGLNEVIRRTDLTSSSTAAPAAADSSRTFRGTSATTTGAGARTQVASTGAGTGTATGAGTNRGTGTPVTVAAPFLGTRPNNAGGDLYSDLRNR